MKLVMIACLNTKSNSELESNWSYTMVNYILEKDHEEWPQIISYFPLKHFPTYSNINQQSKGVYKTQVPE